MIAQNCKRLTVASIVFLPRNPCSSYSGAYNTGQYTSTYYNADYFRQSTRATLSQHHYAPCYALRTPIVCQSRQTRPRCLPADPYPGGIKRLCLCCTPELGTSAYVALRILLVDFWFSKCPNPTNRPTDLVDHTFHLVTESDQTY